MENTMFLLTEDMVKNANSYVPVEKKMQFVEDCYLACLNKVNINLDDGEDSALPDMWMEDTFKKNKCLTGALLLLYFQSSEETEAEDGNQWMLTNECYDRVAGGNLINQLERFKSNNSVRDKVFDLLRDYFSLEKSLSSAIRSGLAVMNDPINRMFQKLAMDTSTEALEAQKQALADLQDQLEKLKEERKESGL